MDATTTGERRVHQTFMRLTPCHPVLLTHDRSLLAPGAGNPCRGRGPGDDRTGAEARVPTSLYAPMHQRVVVVVVAVVAAVPTCRPTQLHDSARDAYAARLTHQRATQCYRKPPRSEEDAEA